MPSNAIRHEAGTKLLRQPLEAALVDAETPPMLDLHLIVDNYATHKHPRAKSWLKRHPRMHLHFTPTSSSWLNLVERWFREITDQRIRRGVFRSVRELIAAIDAYIQEHNENPQPFVWTARSSFILKEVRRARAVLSRGTIRFLQGHFPIGARNESGGHPPQKLLVITEESGGLWGRRRDELSISDDVEFLIKPFKSGPSNDAWAVFVGQLAELVQDRGYSAIIIDTLPSVWPVADENDASKVMQALMPLALITDRGAATLLLHQPRKGDATEGQAARGSGALAGFVDVIVELRRFPPDDRNDCRRVITWYSRFDETPHEQVIELTDNGYVAHGSKADASSADRFDAIASILPADPPGALVEDILNAWPEERPAKPAGRTLRNDLRAGAKARDGQRQEGGPVPVQPTAKCHSGNLGVYSGL